MTDQQIVEMCGVDEAAPLLAARDTVRAKLTPEVYDQCVANYTIVVNSTCCTLRLPSYLITADLLVEQLNKDTSLDDVQRELQKFFVVSAAFDLEEHS